MPHSYLLAPLYPLSLLYGLSMRLRARLYRSGIKKIKRLPCKVISVGNLSVGGTGKTPLVIYIARLLRDRGLKVVVLTRGYKGRMEHGLGLVSDGEKILLKVEEAGDEAVMMAEKLPGVAVLVGRCRYKAGLYACRHLWTQVAILDDGFQRLGLFRDLDILLLDETALRDHPLPLGRLREPISSVRRADLILYPGPEGAMERLGLPAFRFFMRAHALRGLRDGERTDVTRLKGRKVLALSGIAKPHRFYKTLKGLGAGVAVHLAFPDHHDFHPKDYDKIYEASKGAEMIVTTDKDAVRLDHEHLPHLPAYALEMEMEIEEGFEDMLLKATGLTT